MSDVNEYIKEIESLQKGVNDSLVKRETQLSKKQSFMQELEELEQKSQKEFGCSIQDLISKKDDYEKEMKEKIDNLKKVLGIQNE